MTSENQEGRPTKNLMKPLGRYVIEILIIFIGITISFEFDEWREARNNGRKEKEFIESFLTDLRGKKEELQSDSDGAKLVLQKVDSAFICFYDGKQLPDKLILFLAKLYIGNLWFFSKATPTYASSSATGQWQQLPDSLRRKIFDVYETDFVTLEVFYKNSTENRYHFMQNYIAKKGIFSLMEFKLQNGMILKKAELEKIREAFKDKEFFNDLRLVYLNVTRNNIHHNITINHIDSIIADLEALLKKYK